MQIKKMVFFTEPGEKEKLKELARQATDETSLALLISKNFEKLSFTECMQIANIWITNNSKNK